MLRCLTRSLRQLTTQFAHKPLHRAMSTLSLDYHVSGTVEQGFEGVLDAFIDNFKLRSDVGACFVGYHKGRKVVDLWGGYAHPTEKVLWQENTMINTYSTTKGMAITCMLHLVDRGLCTLEDLIVTHWPEFGAANKAAIRITDLLSHRAGLSYLDTPITVAMIEQARDTLDSTLARALATQQPLWQLGEGKHGYSPILVGFYLSQLVRRIDPRHRCISDYWREEIAAPLEIGFHMRLDDSFERAQLAQLVAFDPSKIGALLSDLSFEGGEFFKKMMDPTSMTAKIWNNLAFKWDDKSYLHLEMPSTVGVSNAREIAKLYNYLACGGRVHERVLIRDSSVIAHGTQVATQGPDQVILVNRSYANAGFIKSAKYPTAFYHSGSGGSFGWGDMQHQIAMSYVMNSMGVHFDDPRRAALTAAMYHAAAQLQ